MKYHFCKFFLKFQNYNIIILKIFKTSSLNGHAVKATRIHYAKKELNIIFEENILLPIIENNNLTDALANLFFYYFIFDLQ